MLSGGRRVSGGRSGVRPKRLVTSPAGSAPIAVSSVGASSLFEPISFGLDIISIFCLAPAVVFFRRHARGRF